MFRAAPLALAILVILHVGVLAQGPAPQTPPAAIRRLVRRLFSDAALRGQTERYLRRFAGMLDEAAERDRGGLLVASLLSSDAGRAWLLLDAAAGDLA